MAEKGNGRKRRWRRFGLALVALFLFALGDYHFYPRLVGIGGRSFDQGENGAWLRYKWYFGEHSADQVARLARRLREHRIRDAYFHVRFIKKDGRLRFRYPERARALNARIEALAPEVRRTAWIYAGNENGEGDVRLADSQVRRRMVEEAAWLVRECGFEGVQWDYEICPDGDPSLLLLLEETRAALPTTDAGQTAWIGVAAPTWFPPPIGRFGWSEAYFGEVAKRCDSLAVMGYDTGMYFPRAYVWLVRQQAVRVTRAVAAANPRCRVQIGLPTYEEGPFSHNPWAENLRMGLKGVREGMASEGAKSSVFAGVAIFADYTTDEAEWTTLRALWDQE